MDTIKFYGVVRKELFGGQLSDAQLAGTEAILRQWDADAKANGDVYGLRYHLSYMLATAYWETARTMQPVKEAFWLSEAWRKAHLRYYPWYGRGLVQLTWEANYRRADKELAGNGGALINDPDLALEPKLAVLIMFRGMAEGWFTGRKLSDYLYRGHQDWVGARAIINGTDKAETIASIAEHFDTAILASVQ